MKQAFMRGVCALNMEAMNMFRPGDGNRVTPSNQDNEPGSGDVEQEVIGRDPEFNPHPVHPYHSAPTITHRRGNQENNTQSHLTQAPPTAYQGHLPPNLIIPSSEPTVTSSVQVQSKVLSAKGKSSGGVTSQKRGRGHTKPAVMVERHTLS